MEHEPKVTKSGVHPLVILGIFAAICVFIWIALYARPSASNDSAAATPTLNDVAGNTSGAAVTNPVDATNQPVVNSGNTVSATNSGTKTNTSGNVALQQNCTGQLEAFQKREDEVHNEYIQKAIDAGSVMGNPVMSIDDSSFVIGYSPSLNACVAGYRTIGHDWQMPANTYAEDEYYIVNVATNASIDYKGEIGEWVGNAKVSAMQNDAYDSKGIAADDAARYDFFKEMNQLTAGEIATDPNTSDATYAS
jgi:hypothetical protein